MKLRDVAKGTRAVKSVSFRLANAAPEPPLSADEATAGVSACEVKVGVRVLTGAETAQVYERALADAKAKGVAEWIEEHPICRLYEMVHTLAVACVDVDAQSETFFASADEILQSPDVGTDNIAYLYEQQVAWQDQCSIQTKNLSVDQVIGILAAEAERPENAGESPLVRMRPGLRASCFHITARLFQTLLRDKLVSGSSGDTDTSETPSDTQGAN